MTNAYFKREIDGKSLLLLYFTVIRYRFKLKLNDKCIPKYGETTQHECFGGSKIINMRFDEGFIGHSCFEAHPLL